MEANGSEYFVHAPTISAKTKNGTNAILCPLLPENYAYLITDFHIVNDSDIVGETKFTTTFRVNIEVEESIQTFITEFGQKSGTAYNKVRSDEKGKGIKAVLSGSRKCQHTTPHWVWSTTRV